MQNKKKFQRRPLPYVLFIFIRKYYHENRLICAKPALQLYLYFSSCISRVISSCMQNFIFTTPCLCIFLVYHEVLLRKQANNCYTPNAIFWKFQQLYSYDNNRLHAHFKKKIQRFLVPLAYVFFKFIMKYYYRNRLISGKPRLSFS